MYLLAEVELSSNFSDYIDKDKNQIKNIEFRRLNINVGANNSGKSRFLRLLITQKTYNSSFHNNDIIIEINKLLQYLFNYFNKVNNKIRNQTFSDEKIQQAFVDLTNTISVNSNNIDKVMTSTHILSKLVQLTNKTKIFYDLIPNFTDESYNEKYSEGQLGIITSKVQELAKPYNKVYIPTLRSLRNLDYICEAKKNINNSLTQSKMDRNISFDNDFFKGRTLLDYWKPTGSSGPKFVNLNSNNKYTFEGYEKHIGINIFTGLNMFEELTDMLLGEPNERIAISSWEQFLKVNFFDNKNISITPNRRDGIIRIKIDDDEKAIYDLGDGLQTILVITFVMFKNKDSKSILIIEEPELYLHPSYQRKLVEVMMFKEFNKIQYFVTTHSNHFLDLTIDYPDDISIHHFEKHANKFIITPKSDLNTKYLLKSLGVKPSSMYLSNCIILVEGISDLIYLKKYLEVFMNQENIHRYNFEQHYSFLEYSGSNIEHWSFLSGEINPDCLNPNVFVIADNDNELSEEEFKYIAENDFDNLFFDENSKKERLIKLCSLENSYVLRARETENIIKGSILRQTIINKEKGYNQKFNNQRSINEELIPIFDEHQYRDMYLGRFIDKKLKKFKAIEKGYIYSSSTTGTLNNKNEFSKLVISNIENFDDLSEEAKELTLKVYNFIQKSNSD